MFGCVSGEIAVVLENGAAFEDAVIEDDAVANIAIFRVSVLFSGEFEGLKVAGSGGGREDREGREEFVRFRIDHNGREKTEHSSGFHFPAKTKPSLKL